jgi:uncharacterized protein YbcI
MEDAMNKLTSTVAEQLAQAVRTFQEQQTGRLPKSVTVVLSEDTLVVTLHAALSAAEHELAQSPQGAADLQEYHRQLFRNSVASLLKEIARITGREVREAAVEFDPVNGCIVHAFTTGTMVQVFLLAESGPTDIYAQDGAIVPAIQGGRNGA